MRVIDGVDESPWSRVCKMSRRTDPVESLAKTLGGPHAAMPATVDFAADYVAVDGIKDRV